MTAIDTTALTKRYGDTVALSDLDLSADAGTRIAAYSTGVRQKVAYIQAVLYKPAVVFLSTHILSVVEEIADSVGILYDGERIAEDDPEALTDTAETVDSRTLEDVFLELTAADSLQETVTTDG